MKRIPIQDWQAIFYEQKNLLMIIVEAGDKQVIKAKPTSKGNQLTINLVDSDKNIYEAVIGGFPSHYSKAISSDKGFVLQMGKGNIVANNVKILARS